ncbi:MAG: hypothetical protein EXR79_01350, partial [Myxococcales bacterium]|nr:hypothetical protein [Myxococcales bacterium]
MLRPARLAVRRSARLAVARAVTATLAALAFASPVDAQQPGAGATDFHAAPGIERRPVQAIGPAPVAPADATRAAALAEIEA